MKKFKKTTTTEQNAEWLRNRRNAMIKAINNVVSIVATENFKSYNSSKFNLEFNIGTSGNCVELRVYGRDDCELQIKIDYWNMSEIMEENLFYFDKEKIDIRVNAFLKETNKMKITALKYAKLNEYYSNN